MKKIDNPKPKTRKKYTVYLPKRKELSYVHACGAKAQPL
jgi:hypothetical protein